MKKQQRKSSISFDPTVEFYSLEIIRIVMGRLKYFLIYICVL